MPPRFSTALASLARLISPGLYPRLVHRDRIDVFYHAISDVEIPHVSHLYPVVSTSEFKAALDYLAQNFKFVSYAQLHQAYSGKGALPSRALHLSFDDGFAECFTVVRPVLLERKLPCTFFLTLDWIDNRMLYFRHAASLLVHQASRLSADELAPLLLKINEEFSLSLSTLNDFAAWILHFRSPQDHIFEEISRLFGVDVASYLKESRPYLTTSQIRQLAADGFTIGAHGLTHRKLIDASGEEIEWEIVESCRKIQALTGQEVVPFSFPQSAWGVDRELLADISARNPSVGLLFDTKDLRQDVPFLLNRVWAERPLTPDRKLHPLSEVFSAAYQDAWVDSILEFGRKLRGGK